MSQDPHVIALRESLKEHRDRLRRSGVDENLALASALDTLLLVSYDPNSLLILCHILQDFMNDLIGGEN
jgi:hypothetical protein